MIHIIYFILGLVSAWYIISEIRKNEKKYRFQPTNEDEMVLYLFGMAVICLWPAILPFWLVVNWKKK